jgi:hypothetical protein
MTTIKSIHIKECWPYEYVKPDRRIFKRETMDRANARKREQYQARKLLKLQVVELDIDFCNRLNNA